MKKKFDSKSFMENKIITNLKICENEQYLLYFLNLHDYDNNYYTKKIILFDLKSSKKIELNFSFEVNDFYFENKNIILKELNDNETNIYRYNIVSKTIYKFSSIPFELGYFILDSDSVYFLTEIQKYNEKDTFKCSFNSPFFIENKGVKGDRMTCLFKSSFDGKNISLLSSLDMSIETIDFDLKNNRILFNAKKRTKLETINSELYMYDMQNEELCLLTKGNYRISNVLSFDNQKVMFWGLKLDDKSRNQNQELMIVDCSSKEIYSFDLEVSYSNEHPSIVTDAIFYNGIIFQKYGNKIYTKLVKRNKEIIYEITLDGLIREIDFDVTMINEYVIAKDRIYYIGMKEQNLQEVYSNNKKLTNHNEWLEAYEVVKPEPINFFKIEQDYDAWVLSPSNIEKGKKYPGILVIHGGPKMMYSSVISFDLQLLRTQGYFVFYMNPSGSDGRGDKYSDIRGKFATVPYEELMSFVDFILEKYPEIDENRLGVTGGSYGGYMTNYIISHTNRFKAAVSERSISNLMTAFTSVDIGHEFIYEYMGNCETPWDNEMVYMKNSPIYYANKIKTPTLFIHGEKDYRCHYSESLNMFNALNYHGVVTKFCLFSDESHSLPVKGKPKSKYKRYYEILNWFSKYI